MAVTEYFQKIKSKEHNLIKLIRPFSIETEHKQDNKLDQTFNAKAG